MAEIILTNVLNTNISIDELFNWLTTDNPEESICPDIVQNGSTRAAFISYFLDYLREQCKGILPEMKDMPTKQEKPANKRDYIESPKKNISTSKIITSRNTIESPRHFVHNDYKSRHKGQPTFHPRSPALTIPTSPLPEPLPAYNAPGNFPPLSPQNANSGVPTKTIWKTPLLTAQQQSHLGNSSILENPEAENENHGIRSEYIGQVGSTRKNHDNSCEGKHPIVASSPYNSPINQGQMPIENLHVSSPGTSFDNNISNACLQTNSSTKFENLMYNTSTNLNLSSIPLSPLSPLYSNNTSILGPRRVDRSHNEIHNSRDGSTGSSYTSRASTPNNSTTSGHKNSKSGSKQNLCLGDFIKSDGKDSKRTSKKHAKANYRRQEQVRKEKSDEKTLNNQEVTSSGTMVETRLKRRINPTRLNVSGDKETLGQEVFGMVCRPMAANPMFVEAPSTNNCEEELSFNTERRLLKLQRQRQPKSETTIETVKSETMQACNTQPKTTIVPRLDLVTNVEKLNTLAGIYSGILKRNLMPNPMTELYFMMTLLTTQYRTLKDTKNVSKKAIVKSNKLSSSIQMLEALKNDLGCAELIDDIPTSKDNQDSLNEEGDLDKSLNDSTRESLTVDDSEEIMDNSADTGRKPEERYLNTPHNCVYFATMVILNHHHLLTILDRATLKLLCENHQLIAFQPELHKDLNDIYRVKCLQTNRVKSIGSGNLQSNVCFQVYTDNSEAFPSPFTFGLFRKQRDAFYDLLKDWEDNHLKTTWSFQNALKNKMNAPLAACTDAVNYCHFAKLFISQLLVSSVRNGQSEDPMNDESLSFLKSLKHLNPDKLIQLKGRLVTPLISTGPVPAPMFPGVQEFYEKFILHISNWKFLVVLETTLMHEIMELNEVHFHPSEIEETERTLDESTKQKFITAVCSLRLLAKFAAFMVSLPFRSVADTPVWLQSQIQLRGRALPLLDLKRCLLDALTHRRLSLTVPWIVQYMAMLDTVTLSLPYYASIGELLYSIYRKSNYHRQDACDDFSIPLQTTILMSFTIGWLFELPNFPRDLYTYWQMNYVDKKLQTLGCTSDPRIQERKVVSMDAESSIGFGKYNSTIDELEIIDDGVLYECCPFLIEFKILLISGNATWSNSTANRHITPVSSQLSQSNADAKPKNLQLKLEESFLHGQPSSTRQTIDFVYERIASNCVKYICNVIIPSSKQRNMKKFIKSQNGEIDLLIQKEEDDEDNSSPSASESTHGQSKVQANVRTCQMEVLATTIKEDVKNECRLKIAAMCKAKTINSIEPLLADDTCPSVKETCIAIAMRMALERVQQWIDTHIVESLFLKNMPIELTRFTMESPKINRDSCHNLEVPCPTDVIRTMRNSMWELLEKKGRWTDLSVESVTKTLTSLQQTLVNRSDLVDEPERALYKMSVDYSLLLLTYRQDLFTPEIQQHFQNVWKMSSEDLFTRVISPRNIRMLTSTSDPSVMTIFGCLLTSLLRENLLKIDALSEQCVTLFRQEWPEAILKQLSQCLKNVVADYKCSGEDAQSLKYLVGWIAGTLEDMEICDYD